MTIFRGFSQRVFLVLSMGEFIPKAIVLHCVRIIPNRGRKILVSFFTILWFPSSSPCWSIFPRRFRGSVIQWIFSYGRFHLRCHSICLSGIILRFDFCHHWALFVIEICFGEAITRKDILQGKNKHASLGCCGFFSSDPFGKSGLRRPLRGATAIEIAPLNATVFFYTFISFSSSLYLLFLLPPWVHLRKLVGVLIKDGIRA